jgi:hypothetical protein
MGIHVLQVLAQVFMDVLDGTSTSTSTSRHLQLCCADAGWSAMAELSGPYATLGEV